MAVRMAVAGTVSHGDGMCTLYIKEVGGRERHGAILMRFSDVASVYAALHGLTGKRPSAHIGWAQTVRAARITLEQLIVHGIGGDDAILCLLQFRQGERTWTVDCRPSDGIALALRLDAPLMCEEPILDLMAAEVAKHREETDRQDEEDWRQYIAEHDDELTKQ